MEDELAEWESIRFYARESKLKDMKRKIKRIEQKISARKRIAGNHGEDGQKAKKMRRLNFPLLGEDWGTVPNNQQGVREQLSLAGGGSDDMLRFDMVVCSVDVDGGGAPCNIITTSPTNEMVVVGDERGAAPAPAPSVTGEPAQISELRWKQPLISELLHGVARAAYSDDGQCGTIGEEENVPFDDRVECDPVVCPGDDDGGDGMSGDAVLLSQGIVSHTCNKAMNVKDDLDLLREPSSVQSEKVKDDHCTFKKGVCSLHNARGERYVDKKKRWMDRGGGRGYGWVTSKVVKFRCKVDDDQVEQKSSSVKWGE